MYARTHGRLTDGLTRITVHGLFGLSEHNAQSSDNTFPQNVTDVAPHSAMSRHQHHQLKPVASGAHAHAHATPGSSSSGSRRSSDARANTNTLTYDQLEPGTGLPTGRLHGRLKLLFKEKPDELDFAIKVKLAAASDYVQGQKQQRNIMARFVLIPSPSDNAAFPAEVTQTMAANYALLRRSLGSPFTVECAGCKVASRRTMGDGTTEVTFRATGSRLITIDGTGHEFLSTLFAWRVTSTLAHSLASVTVVNVTLGRIVHLLSPSHPF